jgi:hypothetical protein
MSISLSEENLFNQIKNELQNTLFYANGSKPLHRMAMFHDRVCAGIKRVTHVQIEFPGVGRFILAIRKLK